MNPDLKTGKRVNADFSKPILLTCGLLFAWVILLIPTAAHSSLRMESYWTENPCPAGKPVYLTVDIKWSGKVEQYAVRPPQLDLPDGIHKYNDNLSSRSFRRGDENIISYQWTLLAEKKGQIPPIPIKLVIHQEKGQEPAELEIETEPLLIVNNLTWPYWPGIILGLFVLLSVLYLLWRKSRKRSPAAKQPEMQERDTASLLSDTLKALNTSRIQGDTLSFLQKALTILSLCERQSSEESRELGSLLDQCQYGDLKLSGEEMDKWYLHLKRMIPK